MNKKLLIIGTLDSKKKEFLFVKEQLEKNNTPYLLMNTGVFDSEVECEFTNEDVAVAGGESIQTLQEKNDRGAAVSVMTKGAEKIVRKLAEEDKISGIFGMGGTAGTTISAKAMQAAPIGIPKMIVSTVASGNTRPYVGEKDITMMYSVVDVSGINRISSKIFKNAANAISGMVNYADADAEAETIKKSRPLIATTMFGVTTPCVTRTRELLEDKGYDVLVFHATGAGGDAMEALVRDGFIHGVADITTTELCDNLVGGVFQSKETRLETASELNVPQVVSVGALDMVNFGPPETIPEQFKDRNFYQHNATTTLMRTTIKENKELGEMVAKKLNKSNGNTIFVFPTKGVSMLDKLGQPFYGEEEREALYESIKSNLKKDIPFIEIDTDINDPSVADLIVDKIVSLM